MRVMHLAHMAANKRGPVEFQLLEMARHAETTFVFPVPPAGWFRAEAATVGADVVVLQDWSAARRLVAARRPDVCHLHFGPHDAVSAPLVVRTEHSYRPGASRLRSVARWWRARNIDAFVAVSDYMVGQTRRDFLRPATRIYNGTRLDEFQPRQSDRDELKRDLFGVEGRLVATMAAHLHPGKAQDLLVEAWKRMPREHVLVLAGGGMMEATLRRQAAGMENVWIVSGDNDVARIYGASDVGVLLSRGEGFGGSGMEALACGLPLIVSPVGGAAELGTASECVFVDLGVGSVVAALRRLFADDGLRAKMGAAGRARAEAMFDVRRTATETLNLYERLV